MLVLSRKVNEQILIGDDIKITLLRVRGGKVRVGIEAPRDLRVVRGELAPKEQPAPSDKVKFSEKVELNEKGELSDRLPQGDRLSHDHPLDDNLTVAEIDPVAEVFANPQPQQQAGQPRGKAAACDSVIRQAARQTSQTVGNVTRRDDQLDHTRDALSGFVSAS